MSDTPEPVKTVVVKVKKKGAPAYMVSFGDMMTLILCFFILLVSMAKERNFGLLARGVGSFIIAVESHGLTGILSGEEEERIFDNVRRRFNLPPEQDPERRTDHVSASRNEILQAERLEKIEPFHSILQPQVALFAADSAALDEKARAYLDRLAMTLRPERGQVLLLDGHAFDAAERFQYDNPWLAYARAAAVREYLVDEHGFRPGRVQARGFLEETIHGGNATRAVDARLITPADK